MPLIPAKCTSCGGVLSVDESKDAAVCPYCGNAFVVEKAIQNFSATYVINNIQADTVIMNGGQKDFDISAGRLTKYNGEDVNVTIPDNVDCIASRAFSGLNIQSVTIPGTVETIEEMAFYNCAKLKRVTFNKGLKEIGKKAFANCPALESLDIPDGVSLKYCCFSYDIGLKEIRLSTSTIKASAGSDCFVGQTENESETNAKIYVDGERLFNNGDNYEVRSFFSGITVPYKNRAFAAKTVEKAVQLACQCWNCTEEDIKYNVTQEPKETIFTTKEARISAEYIGE